MNTKIVVISDSHGSIDPINYVVKNEYPFSHLFYCGDGMSDILNADIPQDVIVYKVTGNVDRISNYNGNEEIYAGVDGQLFYLVHGDKFGVKVGFDHLISEAIENEVDVVIFGHTHVQYDKINKNIKFFNPGSIKLGEYGIIEKIDKEWKFLHKSLK